MQIVCPNCKTFYEVPITAFGAGERSVRCARCHAVWVASAVPSTMSDFAKGDHPADSPGPRPSPSRQERPAGEPRLAQEPPRAGADLAAASDAVSAETGDGSPPADWIDKHVEQALGDASDRHVDEGAPPPDIAPESEAESTVATSIEDAPPLAPDTPNEPAPTSDPAEDIETFAARHTPPVTRTRQRQRQGWPLSNWPTAIIALAVMVSVLIGWRNDVVQLMPQTASFFSAMGLGVNLRGLTFADVKTSYERRDGVNVLLVEGKIVSLVPKPIEVPRLRFSVRDKAGQEIYAWTALLPHTTLAPGKAMSFHSRLASPPPQTRTVLVRFFNHRDVVAGTR